MLTLDGSIGEGGGQILRTALSLSLITGTPFRLQRVRAHRPRPGLQRQHLASVEAAARVSGGRVSGATLGSTEVGFEPGPVQPGAYRLAIGTAGSATLVLQTVLMPLVLAAGPSRLQLEGGTHNPWAPPFEFLSQAFLPLVAQLGPRFGSRLERWGFYPAGGGRFEVEVAPAQRLRRLELTQRGPLKASRVFGVAAGLPRAIAARSVETALGQLRLPQAYVDVREVASDGPGHALLIELLFENVSAVVTGFGEKGVRPEEMAAAAAEEAREFLDAGVPVGTHLADQLLLPLALAGGSFLTLAPTAHTSTNLEVIRRFLPVDLRCEPQGHGVWRVSCEAGHLAGPA